MDKSIHRYKHIISLMFVFSMVLSVIIIGVQPVEVKAAQISYLSDNQYY